MAELENPKHERFAQLVAIGVFAHKAYVESGFAADPSRSNSSKLLKREDVQARIQELHEIEAKRLQEAMGDGSELTGEQLARLTAMKALATNNLTALGNVSKILGEADGSFAALAPPDKNTMGADELAARLATTTGVAECLWRSLLPDGFDDPKHAAAVEDVRRRLGGRDLREVFGAKK